MPTIAQANDRITFKPGPGWQWQGWSGTIALSPPTRSLTQKPNPWLIETDLLELNQQLLSRAYTASGFDAVPGTIVSAVITIESSSLSQLLKLNGKRVVLTTTQGKFRVMVSPASNSVPSPDPMATKTGSFTIESDESASVVST